MPKKTGGYLGGSTVIVARPKDLRPDDSSMSRTVPYTPEEQRQNERFKKQMLGGYGLITKEEMVARGKKKARTQPAHSKQKGT